MRNTINFFLGLTWGQKLLVFAIIAVATSLIFKLITPTQVETQKAVLTNIANVTTNLQGITFTGTPPAIPEKISTGTLLSYEEMTIPVKDTLVTQFGLTQKQGTTDTWEGNGYTLSISDDQKSLTLSQSVTPATTAQPQFSPELVNDAIGISDSIMLKIYPENSPKVLTSDLRYLAGGLEPVITKNVSEAEFVLIPYSYQLNNYPVYLNQETQYLASFMFNAQKQLVKADFRPYKISFSAKKDYTSLSMPMAISNVNNNNAALLYTDSYGRSGNLTLNIDSGELKNAIIEYRADPTTNTLIPYYHFYGTLKEIPTNDVTVQIVTPAIQTDFTKSLKQ